MEKNKMVGGGSLRQRNKLWYNSRTKHSNEMKKKEIEEAGPCDLSKNVNTVIIIELQNDLAWKGP